MTTAFRGWSGLYECCVMAFGQCCVMTFGQCCVMALGQRCEVVVGRCWVVSVIPPWMKPDPLHQLDIEAHQSS